jgi:hypothetical protein
MKLENIIGGYTNSSDPLKANTARVLTELMKIKYENAVFDKDIYLLIEDIRTPYFYYNLKKMIFDAELRNAKHNCDEFIYSQARERIRSEFMQTEQLGYRFFP